MDMTTIFKILIFVGTLVVSLFLAWLDHQKQIGLEFSVIFGVGGFLALLIYELYTRLRRDILSLQSKFPPLLRNYEKSLNNMEMAQVHMLHSTDRFVEALDKIVEHMEAGSSSASSCGSQDKK